MTEGRTTPHWTPSASITTKLVAMVLVFLLVIAMVMGLFTLTYRIKGGIRAYVGGEGLWSKGQKDAVYALSRYLDSGDEADLREYEAAIALPLGDRMARLEMEKPRFDPAVVTAGFVQGGNAAEDVPSMIFLFRHLGQAPFFAQAIETWRAAERELLLIEPLAAEARRAHADGTLQGPYRKALMERLHTINARVTPLEQQFSQLLAAGAREVHALLQLVTLASATALGALGALCAWSIARDLRQRLQALRDGVLRVAMGVLTQPIPVRSSDELGELAEAFNEMTASRRRAEAALRSANDFRERVMQNATNAIYTFDLEGRFTSANRRTTEIIGCTLEELLGRSWGDFVPEGELASIQEGFASTIRGGPPIVQREVAVLRPDGRTVQVSFSTAPLTQEGQVVGVVGTAEDITVRKHAEAQLKNHAEELARSNRELEQFAYVASHDLQEPLRTVSGFAQLLSRRYQGRLDAEADEFIGFITAGVTRMKSLIEDLLAYARVQREHQAVGPVALERTLAAALANLAGAIQQSGATVTHSALPVLAVDPQQFTQLFQNLIGNALKFRGEEAPQVKVSAEPQAGHWLFTVSDNGIGIDAAAAERVFVLFQRLHTRDHYEGNGIGLTICKKIVELHGGRIWVEPTPTGGRGAVFRFTLPR